MQFCRICCAPDHKIATVAVVDSSVFRDLVPIKHYHHHHQLDCLPLGGISVAAVLRLSVLFARKCS